VRRQPTSSTSSRQGLEHSSKWSISKQSYELGESPTTVSGHLSYCNSSIPICCTFANHHTIKVEVSEQSLARQGTLVTDQDDCQAKHWLHTVCAVSDQSDSSETVALRKRVDETQITLEQATKGIAALAAGPWSGRATQSNAAASVGSAPGAGSKKSTSKGAIKAQGASRGKFGCGGTHRCPNPKTDPFRICKQLGHSATGSVTNARSWALIKPTL